MYNNINYFYQVTGPLHNQKGYLAHMETLHFIISNMTVLVSQLDSSKEKLDEVEKDLHKEADKFFSNYDKNLELDHGQKSEMFEDEVGEILNSAKMMRNKFKVIDQKVEELGDLTEQFHESTDRLEQLFKKDVEKRKKYYQDHQLNILGGQSQDSESPYLSGMDLQQVDAIFDKLESEEGKGLLGVLFSLGNLSLLGVIGLSAFKLVSPANSRFGKNRVD